MWLRLEWTSIMWPWEQCSHILFLTNSGSLLQSVLYIAHKKHTGVKANQQDSTGSAPAERLEESLPRFLFKNWYVIIAWKGKSGGHVGSRRLNYTEKHTCNYRCTFLLSVIPCSEHTSYIIKKYVHIHDNTMSMFCWITVAHFFKALKNL